ncbi:transporter, SSS family [Leptospira yanagawae serovar Saopaulo str. Sao Paulo = ATCC 700523]|uniref:Transporter, SSS family n=1 Tax=Leptospira yanagawae serovar Saopaulo str. Sao Paulo = ATCC 700523 TaxID=1249483 RepID=A0A5E8HFU6_9LEPT|nr:sodium/solute symporter [Leptospira yanagawae]EOQ90134.1 transporter, SSS family [Leptospira yanagawae serovar Saopaulo str. Sao Paulo = ATCC 700523]
MITTIDILFFGFTFLLVLGIGMYAGRKESSSKDYFLGGRSLPWWGIAGSLFGTNISANHLVGMLGIGFSVGFAQSHYEFGSIPAIVLLAFVFLPLFRRKKFFTLSQFLQEKFGKQTGRIYSAISLILITIQLTGALYIGARSFLPFLENLGLTLSYAELVIWIAFTSTIYTWFGGLKSVVYTDVIQTFLILASGLVLAYLSISRPEVGGIVELFAKEENRLDGLSKMNLYLPPNHPTLPWTGALSGLFLLHTFYWNTNQYVVQRTLGGKSLREARFGILVGGLLKLTVPFFSILTGVAAYQIWSSLGETANIAPDEAFSKLVVLVVPVGYGLIGVILAGLLGAIFSSIDSMLHSAATLFTIDFYKPFFEKKGKPLSDEEEMKSGRIFLFIFSVIVTAFAILLIDPNSKKNFFIELSNQSSHFTPALLVVFLLGIFNVRIHTQVICGTILLTPIVSLFSPYLYSLYCPNFMKLTFGEELNFLHRVFLIFHFALLVLLTSAFLEHRKRNEESETNTQIQNQTILFGVIKPFRLRNLHLVFIFIVVFLFLIYVRVQFPSNKLSFAVIGFLLFFLFSILLTYQKKLPNQMVLTLFRKRDEWLYGILLGITFSFYLYF